MDEAIHSNGRKLKISDFIDDEIPATRYNTYRRGDKVNSYRKQTEYGDKKYIKP